MTSRVSADVPLIALRPRAGTTFVSRNRTVLALDADGAVRDDHETGLFVDETRLVSRLRYLIDGDAPHPVALSTVQQDSWLGYYVRLTPGLDEPRHERDAETLASQHSLELRVARVVGDGMHEDVELTNFSQRDTSFRLELEIRADFADLHEVGGERRQRGRTRRRWLERDGGGQLLLDYRARHAYAHQGDRGVAHVARGVAIRVVAGTSRPRWERGRIAFDVDLASHARWRACVVYAARIDGAELAPPSACCTFAAGPEGTPVTGPGMRISSEQAVRIPSIFVRTMERAATDLAALRLDVDGGPATLCAGIPGYVGLFGRDTMISAQQAAMLTPTILEGALSALAPFQGRRTDDWRDEQPGRVLHEAHTGPLARLAFDPHGRYYGSFTSSPLYPIALATMWRWTADGAATRARMPHALAAIEWLDRHGDIDGDGFYEYRTRSEQGLRNQGWKDSGDAMVHADGRQATPPIATCEAQAFGFAAKRAMAELHAWLGDRDRAVVLVREADELARRFNDVFWMEDEGYFALGLDRDKSLMRSIGSDPGHCLGTGVMEPSRAARTADRLLGDDLFTGWGIRTLSSRHPAFDPYSYHRGSVWPVEHGIAAVGLSRYGFHGHVERIARALVDAAALFEHQRLPEVFSGHARDAGHPFPAFYTRANSPQAWSASAVFAVLEAMLGVFPYAPLRLLMLDPVLPAWLDTITVEHLRVGAATVTLRFRRAATGETDYEVLDLRGPLDVLRYRRPWSLLWEAAGADLRDRLESARPGTAH